MKDIDIQLLESVTNHPGWKDAMAALDNEAERKQNRCMAPSFSMEEALQRNYVLGEIQILRSADKIAKCALRAEISKKRKAMEKELQQEDLQEPTG
jgi:hypothetical protein